MVGTHGAGRLRAARGSRGIVPSVGRLALRLLLARPLREGLARRRATAERRPRRRRGRGREYGSPGLLYEDARFRESPMSCASLGDAARSLVCCQASLVRGRVPRESAALYLWRAALLVRCRVDSAATPSSSAASMASSSAASTWNALHAQATARGRDVAPPPRHRADAAHRKKKRIRSTSWRNTLEKPTAGDAPCRNRYGKARR